MIVIYDSKSPMQILMLWGKNMIEEAFCQHNEHSKHSMYF